LELKGILRIQAMAGYRNRLR